MTFEGQQINIPIKGIIRAGTDNLCADGSMNEVIGLEYKDGSWLPYKETEADINLPDFTAWRPIRKTYVHKTSDNNVHYVILTHDRALYVETERDSDGNVSVALLATDVKDVEMVGNMLCAATDRGIEYYLWKDGEYHANTLSLPEIAIRTNAGFVNDNSKIVGVQYCQQVDVVEDNGRNTLNAITMAAVVSALGGLRDKGGLSGYCLGCYAYRLKYGEFVMASAPFLLGKPMQKHGCYKDGHRFVNIVESEDFHLAGLDTTIKMYSQFAEGGAQSQANHVITSALRSRIGQQLEFRYPNYAKEGVSEIKEVLQGTYHGDGEGQVIASWGKSEDDSSINRLTDQPYIPDMITSLVYQDVNTSEWHGKLFAFAAGNGLQYKVLSGVAEENNIVESLCLFLTPEVTPYVLKESETDYREMFLNMGGSASRLLQDSYDTSKYYNIFTQYVRRKPETQIAEELKKLNTFYLVEEKSLSSIEVDGEWHSVELAGKLGDNLLVREQLQLSAFDHTKTYANNLSSYNLRLHQFDYSQEAFKGYSVPMMGHNGGLGQYEKGVVPGSCNWEIEVEIEDEDGSRRVVNYGEEGTLTAYMTPILTYPSDKAVSMTIRFFKYSGMGGKVYMKKTYPLRHDMGLGFSYYIDPDLKPIPVNAGESQGTPPNNLPVVEPENIIRYYPNGLKVSDVAYPSYFPAQYTYRIGNEKIIALARLTRPVSQDNFGTFQLIVFCTDGIYTMEVDKSGAGVYTNIAFLSPEVCTNPNTICEIGGAVIFAGDKGLMVLTSSGVEEFTPQLNGEINFSPSDQTQYIKDGQHIFKKIITTKGIVSLDGALSTEDFIDYLHDEYTMVSYVSIKNKILVYNQNKPYVYFIDIATRNTTKLNVSVAFDDDNSPVELYFSKEYNQRYNKFHYTSYKLDYRSADGVVDCLIQSRPIKIQQDDKGSFRLVMTGYFDGDAGQWAELVVLASLDGKNWRAIGVKEKRLEGGFHNLGCVTERGSWKYLMFIFAGQLKNNSHIDSIDLTVEGKYNNKKR